MQVENLEFDHSGKFIHRIGQFKLCCVPCWTNHLRTRVEATPSETPERRKKRDQPPLLALYLFPTILSTCIVYMVAM